MATGPDAATVTIAVDPETARAFAAATEPQRHRIGELVRLQIRSVVAEAPRDALRAAIGRLSNEAQSRGMTPEILDEILREGRDG